MQAGQAQIEHWCNDQVLCVHQQRYGGPAEEPGGLQGGRGGQSLPHLGHHEGPPGEALNS